MSKKLKYYGGQGYGHSKEIGKFEVKAKVNKKLLAAANKLLESKKIVLAYSRGELSKADLEKHGVELAMPL